MTPPPSSMPPDAQALSPYAVPESLFVTSGLKECGFHTVVKKRHSIRECGPNDHFVTAIDLRNSDRLYMKNPSRSADHEEMGPDRARPPPR